MGIVISGGKNGQYLKNRWVLHLPYEVKINQPKNLNFFAVLSFSSFKLVLHLVEECKKWG